MDLWLNVALPDLAAADQDGSTPSCSTTAKRIMLTAGGQRVRGPEEDSPDGADACGNQAGFPWLHPVQSGGFVHLPGLPAAEGGGPDGAGDSFVGGMMGYLAAAKGLVDDHIRRAMVYGSVVASFCCEGFGLQRTTRITRAQIDGRVKELERLTRF
jgi:hypothetical protein